MRITVRASHVIVIAIAALALVFGTGVAGAVAGQKWINGHHIKPNSIPANRIQKRTVTTKALTRATLDTLEQTSIYVDKVVTSDDTEPSGYVAVTCPESTQVVAGYVKPGGTGLVTFGNSYIDPDRNALMVQFSVPGSVTVQTICLS